MSGYPARLPGFLAPTKLPEPGTALHLQGLYRSLLDSGLSGSTAQKTHHLLHKTLAQAGKWDLIPRNAADLVEAPSPSKKQMRGFR